LPKCPCTITVDNGEASYDDTKDEWKEPGKPSDWEERLHPGIEFSMRSEVKEGHTNQCTYGPDGKLYTGPPQAGTVDIAPAGTLEHMAQDVFPLHWAVYLDHGIIMHVAWGPKTPGPPDYSIGKYMRKYYNKRPLHDDDCPRNEKYTYW